MRGGGAMPEPPPAEAPVRADDPLQDRVARLGAQGGAGHLRGMMNARQQYDVSTRLLCQGDLVVEYVGEIVDQAECRRRLLYQEKVAVLIIR